MRLNLSTPASKARIRDEALARHPDALSAKIDLHGGVHVLRYLPEQRRRRWVFVGWDIDVMQDAIDRASFRASRRYGGI